MAGSADRNDLSAKMPEKTKELDRYDRTTPAEAPSLPVPGPVFNTMSRAEFFASRDRPTPSPDQYDPPAAQSVCTEMLASDAVGATWGGRACAAPRR